MIPNLKVVGVWVLNLVKMFLVKHKQNLNNKKKRTKTNNEPQVYLKICFHENNLYLRINADFDCTNETDDSSVSDKNFKIYKQTPVCNGC